MVLGLVLGCSKAKAPQAKEEPAAEKIVSTTKKKDKKEEPAAEKIVSTTKKKDKKEESGDLSNDVKPEMVLIPAGKFTMGVFKFVKDPIFNDDLQHEVTLTRPYYIGKYEVTREQWKGVMGNDPSRTKAANRTKWAKLPVTDVSWNDCQEFIKKLNAKTKIGYRLPTEAEWEYACRAGTITAYSFGDKITPKDANYDDLKLGEPVAVGSYKPNAFGLYDMHGNVSEWCEDWYADYPAGAVTDPKGPVTGPGRVLRGGDFKTDGRFAHSSSRSSGAPNGRAGVSGFRLAKDK